MTTNIENMTNSPEATPPTNTGDVVHPSTTSLAPQTQEPQAVNQINPNISALQQPLANMNKDAWYNNIKDENLRGYAELKKFMNPEEALAAYKNLEEFVGAEKTGHAVVMPDEKADKATWDKFFEKLGRPSNPDDYKLNVPEGLDGSMSKQAASWMHEIGLNQKQAAELNNKYNEYMLQTMQAAEAKYQQDQETQIKEIMASWGNNADKNVELVRRGVRAAGLDENSLAAIDKALGTKKVYEVFQRIGASYLEDNLVTAQNANPWGMSPEAARVEINNLIKDKEFFRKLNSGDSVARQRWDNLNAVATKRD